MLTYVVTAQKQKVIEGLGVFEAGEKRIFGQTDAEQFQRLRGIPLNNDVDDVDVVIYVQEDYTIETPEELEGVVFGEDRED